MPAKTGSTLKDPVGAIARGIVRVDALGHADMSDFVREACRLLDIPQDYDRDEAIANVLFEDCGEKYGTEQQMAAFIYSRLVV